MTIKQKAKVLKEHGFNYSIRNNNIFCYSPYTKNNGKESGYTMDNLTNYTKRELYYYLGY